MRVTCQCALKRVRNPGCVKVVTCPAALTARRMRYRGPHVKIEQRNRRNGPANSVVMVSLRCYHYNSGTIRKSWDARRHPSFFLITPELEGR